MTVTVDLPTAYAEKLAARAEQAGVEPSAYAATVLIRDLDEPDMFVSVGAVRQALDELVRRYAA